MSKSPKIVPLPYQADASVYFEALDPLPNRVWLDSRSAPAQPSSDQANAQGFDILSAAPTKKIASNDVASVESLVHECFAEFDQAPAADCPFPGGAIGFVEYEAQHDTLAVTTKAHNDMAPSSAGIQKNNWAIFDWALIQDREKKQSYAIFQPSCSQTTMDHYLSRLKNATESKQPAKHGDFEVSKFQHDVSKADYARAYEQIKHYILAGDCYQINYAQRFSAKFSGLADKAYTYLRQVLSGSYAAYLDFDEHKILSFSPEQFIQATDNKVQTKPIKGTIKRSKNRQEDTHLAQTLKLSAKDQAENVMIVDLLRNDFSKTCVPYSVKVPKLFALESYQNVHHLVSTVTGTIADDKSQADVFHACFPGGSITGAPKKRAMEIIDELEAHPRRIYCGSIVCLAANQQLRSSIAIRTLLIENNSIYCWGGGGIVADSELDTEYQESIQKVQILMDALERF